jgi:predicted KAP-like P-loop ATPase
MLKSSYPNFSIGLYGEWGTGKTTLMKFIYNQLKSNKEIENQSIIPVWFNA